MESPLDFPSEEFFVSEKLDRTSPKSRKGGRYPDHVSEKRRQEVYMLHFDYGYSARKIAQLLKVNRHTIDADIQHLYGKITKKSSLASDESWVTAKIEQLEIQRTRIRKILDDNDEFSHRITLERMLSDIDNKIIQIRMRLINSSFRQYELGEFRVNEWLKGRGEKSRKLSLAKLINIPERCSARIFKMLERERNLGRWI